MRNGAGEFNVAHALTTHFSHGDFDTALLADHTTMLQAFVFTTQAFVVLDGTKNLGAKQAIAFGFERTVVDSFRFANFAIRPRADLFWRSDADLDGIELFVLRNLFEKVE